MKADEELDTNNDGKNNFYEDNAQKSVPKNIVLAWQSSRRFTMQC